MLAICVFYLYITWEFKLFNFKLLNYLNYYTQIMLFNDKVSKKEPSAAYINDGQTRCSSIL